MAATAEATYAVKVGWDSSASNPFIIGSSTLSGGDVLTSSFTVDFLGSDDDITSYVKSINIKRGRSDALGPMTAGEANIVLHDPDGRFNPQNSSSPLYGKLLPMRQMLITGNNDGVTDHALFRGFIRSIEHDPTKGVQETTINAVDLFLWMSRVNPVIPSISPLNTGSAIEALVVGTGWTISSLTDLDDGDELPAFSTDGSKSALSVVSDLLETELGLFFIEADGTAHYEDRHARARRSSAVTFTSTLTAAKSGVDLDTIVNRMKVTKDGGTEQTASNPTSVNAYGLADESISSGYLMSDSQALALANYLVAIKGEPKAPIWELGLMNSTAASMTQILTRELGDRITVNAPLGGTAGDYYIESISHSITDGGKYHQWSAALSEKSGGEVFIIGSSRLSAGDVLTF